MARKRAKWRRGSFFLLREAEFHSKPNRVRVLFDDGDVLELACRVLWQGRAGKPLWNELRIDGTTRGCLLVPTQEGAVEEIPGDVIRATRDEEFRAYLSSATH